MSNYKRQKSGCFFSSRRRYDTHRTLGNVTWLLDCRKGWDPLAEPMVGPPNKKACSCPTDTSSSSQPNKSCLALRWPDRREHGVEDNSISTWHWPIWQVRAPQCSAQWNINPIMHYHFVMHAAIFKGVTTRTRNLFYQIGFYLMFCIARHLIHLEKWKCST